MRKAVVTKFLKNKDLSFSIYFFKTFQKISKKKIKIFRLVFISLRLFQKYFEKNEDLSFSIYQGFAKSDI